LTITTNKNAGVVIGRYLPAWFLWGSKEAHSVLSLELTCEAHLETLMVSKEQ
jgi:hypothetical protein